MIQVGVAASSIALRTGLRALLETDPEIQVIEEAASFISMQQDEFLVDVWVVAGPASETSEFLSTHLASSDSPPSVLWLVEEPSRAVRLPRIQGVRAWGLLPVDCTTEELLAAVRALQQGLLVGEPSLMQPHLGAMRESSEKEPIEPLTERETQVLQRLASGLANKQIAIELGISEHTVKFHVSAIYAKLGASNRTEAVRIGVRQGWVIF